MGHWPSIRAASAGKARGWNDWTWVAASPFGLAVHPDFTTIHATYYPLSPWLGGHLLLCLCYQSDVSWWGLRTQRGPAGLAKTVLGLQDRDQMCIRRKGEQSLWRERAHTGRASGRLSKKGEWISPLLGAWGFYWEWWSRAHVFSGIKGTKKMV